MEVSSTIWWYVKPILKACCGPRMAMLPENIVLSRIDYIVYIQAECACFFCRAGPQKNEQSNLVRQSWRELSLVVACLVGELPN